MRTNESGAIEVLLGRKKTGLGIGKVVGLGGKLEPGESAEDAIIREVLEESGVHVPRAALDARGGLDYRFPHKESWTQESSVFVATEFVGIPVETDEIEPHWYTLDAVPYELMWDDAKHWLPQVLRGGQVWQRFDFAEDLETVSFSALRADDWNGPA